MIGGFNWVDLLIIVILIFFFIEGFGKRFIPEVLELSSFVIAFIISLKFYNSLANLLQNNFKIAYSLANVLGFIGLWFLIETFLVIVIQLIFNNINFPNNKITKYLNLLSPIPSVLRGLVFISIILVMVSTFPIKPNIKQAVLQSKISVPILSYAKGLETPLKNVFGAITEDSMTLFTIKPKSDETVSLGFKTTDFKPNPFLEKEMIDLVNKERTSRGLKALVFEPKLQEIARLQSADMLTNGYFSHYSSQGKNVADRAESNGINYQVIGENLAYAPNLPVAHSGLMNSEGHRANILSQEYSKIGIGIEDAGIYGLMITQVFKN